MRSWGVLVPALLALTVGQGLVQTTMSSALAGRAPPAAPGRDARRPAVGGGSGPGARAVARRRAVRADRRRCARTWSARRCAAVALLLLQTAVATPASTITAVRREGGVAELTAAATSLPCGNNAIGRSRVRWTMSDFSLELNEDQVQIQKWVHEFAEQTIRPAAHEWDEREETPWPIIEEAARIGLYSWDFVANAFADPTGLLLPVVMEEMAWGDAGIGLAIFGTTLGVAGIVGQRDARPGRRMGPPVLRNAGEDPAGRLLRLRAGRRLRRRLAAHPGRLRRGHGRMGPRRDQDLDHQRRHRRRPRRGGDGRPGPRRPGAGQLHRAAGDRGPDAGPEVQEDGHPGVPHR